MASTIKVSKREIENVYDNKLDICYQVGRFLGKGGFAKCYEFQNIRTKKSYAGKIISKTLLMKAHQKDKVAQEILIHRNLSHRYIVGFHSYFEDTDNIYIILELCRKRSLLEMFLRRKTVTEAEVRYFARQIVLACIYLHQKCVIHRDLKLGNLFINDNMEVQVGDFGLATKVLFEGERKQTLCGTPNYIAPEILNKSGHSYEVDVWSLGCVIYTLLVGAPPFETNNLSETYMKIRRNDYDLPMSLKKNSKALLRNMLQLEPTLRPTMANLLSEDFFLEGYLPKRLPMSCLTMPPRFPVSRNKDTTIALTSKKSVWNAHKEQSKEDVFFQKPLKMVQSVAPAINGEETGAIYEPDGNVEESSDCYLSNICQLLRRAVANRPSTSASLYDEALDPAAMPFIWISKWVDYTDKYGFGYQLCDNSCGVLFNDSTSLIMLADSKNFHYIERNGNKAYYTVSDYPEILMKKVTLMTCFQSYMINNLVKAGGSAMPVEGDEFTQVPYLRAWFRSNRAMVFHLTNGTLQLNFYEDHTKIILCPLMGAVSLIDENKEFSVYRLKNIKRYGCSSTLFSRLEYAKLIAEKLSSAEIISGKAMVSKEDTIYHK